MHLFKESALWADSFYKLKCLYVCVSVCVFVRYTLSLCLTVILPPLPKVHCPNFLDFRNPWGKVRQKKISDLKTLAYKGCKIAVGKK